ncbi:Hypothetical Protein FCC1311_001012 [Hondaea fermentalgiana]|uniref:Uncharacterized protein n=1 Tax=Hondaea fermentalgiana TaxID=2315210 RepID=A0A2R5FYP8_9STRA|nr:Hypothetical Protein FCC1311_001012 [Hondaea fermentalgiana]|eukprot:GBG23882.1 Hypothetical Protein FCC1311_001012 [Hondaea fermentalgiana]
MIVPVLLVTVTVLIVVGSFLYGSNSATDSDSDSDSDSDGNSVDSQSGREAPNAKQLIEDFSARFRTAFGARRGASREQNGARDEMAFVHGVSGALRGAGALLLAPVAATGAMAADGALNLRARRMPRQRSLQRSFSSREEDLARDESRHFVPQVGERFAEGAIQHHPCLVTTMKAHEDLTTAVAFSPSGQYVATAGGEHESEIRLSLRATLVEDEALARSHVIRLPVDDWVGALAFSKDSFFLVVGTGVLGQILVYHVYRRFSTKPTLEASFASDHVGPIRHLYMSTVPGTDTHYIASAASEGDTALKFWSFGTSKPKLLHKFELEGRFALVEKVRFSSTGKLLAVVGREDASEDIASSALFFMVRFAHVGRVRKMWTVHRIDEAKVPEEDSEGVSDVSFAQRSAKLAILQGASWKVLKVRDGRLARLDSYDNMNPAAQPFSAIALADRRQMVITAREGNLHYFQLREDGKVPRLAEVINGAQDSVIQSISVGPEDDQIASLGANSASARIWSLGEES